MVSLLGWATLCALASGRGWNAWSGEVENGLGLLALTTVVIIAVAARRESIALGAMLSGLAPWFVLFEVALQFAQIAGVAGGTSGTLPNSTYYGQVLLLSLPFVLAHWDGHLDRGGVTRVLLACSGLVALAASGARVALAAAVVWFVYTVFSRTSLGRVARTALIGAVVTVSAAGALLFARQETLGTLTAGSLGLRIPMWSLAVRAIGARPVLGWGPDGFAAGGAAVSTTALAGSTPTLLVIQPGGPDPHSVIAWTGVSLGLVGLVLLGWLAVAVAARWKSERPMSAHQAAAAWGIALVFAVMLTAPIAVQVLPLFAIVMGTSLAVRLRAGQDDAALPRWVSWVALLATAAICATLMSNALTRLPLESVPSGRFVAIPPTARAAARAWSFDPHIRYLVGQHVYASVPQAGRTAVEESLVHLSAAGSMDKRNPYYPLYRAVVLRDQAAPAPMTAQAFEESFARYPFHPFGRIEKSLWLVRESRYDEAVAELEIARLTDPQQVPSMGSLIQQVEALIP